MNENLILGIGVTAVPLLVLGYLMLRRQRSIFAMFAAMVLVGVGYLAATGAMEDIGSKVSGAMTPANAPVEATAGEDAIVPAPAAETPAASAPAAEPAPAATPDAAPVTPAAPAPEPAPATP